VADRPTALIHGAAEGLREAMSQHVAAALDAAAGLVFDARAPLADWSALEDRLSEAISLSQTAYAEKAPVVYVVAEAALLGRADVLRSACAGALLSAVRTIAFEGARQQQVALLVAVSETATESQLAETIAFGLGQTGMTGQALHVGTEHFGRSQP
jgi:hypothetical protein